MNTTLMAGASETVITSIKDRPEVYAELYARVLVLADGEKQLAIVTADYGQFPLQYNRVLLDAVQGATGIPPEHVVINCSHTHNAPGVDGRWITEESEAWLATCLAELVKDAVDKLEPATLRVGRAPVQVGYNRRIMNDEGYIVMAPNPEGACCAVGGCIRGLRCKWRHHRGVVLSCRTSGDCPLVERGDRC